MSHSPRKWSKRGEDDDANETSLDYLCPKTDQCPLKTMFEFPERCMRRIFRAITVNICKHPIIYLLGYLALTSVVIVTSFILVTPTSVAVYNAYQPKLYKQRSELSNEIDASWNQFLNKSISEVSYDQFRILFYDVQMRNTTEKVNLFNGVKKVCHFVEVFNVSWAANNSTLSFSAMNEKLNYSDQIPQLCQLARKAEPYMELAEQVGVMNTLTSFLTPEVLKKHLGNDIGDVDKMTSAEYVSALPPITFRIERSRKSEKWQFELIKAISELREILETGSNFKMTYSSSAYMRSEEMMVLHAEIPKLVISIVILVITTLAICLNCSSWHYSKALMAIAAVTMSILAVLTGLAIGNLCRFKYLSLLAFIPFLIIGIGLDSAFLLVHQWLLVIRSGRPRSHTELMVETVEGCFLSVTLSDFTAIGAFGVGAITPFQAVNLCCVYLALCVAFLWLTELFFFLPCLAIKSIRIFNIDGAYEPKRSKTDFVVSKEERKEEMSYGTGADVTKDPEASSFVPEEGLKNLSSTEKLPYPIPSYSSTKSIPKRRCNIFETGGDVFNVYERSIMRSAVFITSKGLFRVIWVLLFICISVSAVYNISIMKPYEANDKYYDDNSVSREYYVAIRDYALWKSAQTRVIIPDPYFYDPFYSQRMLHLRNEFAQVEVVSQLTWLNCYLNFTERLRNNTVPFEELELYYPQSLGSNKRKKHEGICENFKQHGLSQIKKYNDKVEALVEECDEGVSYSVKWETIFCGNLGDTILFSSDPGFEPGFPDYTNYTAVNVLYLDYIAMKPKRKMVQMGDTSKECELMDVLVGLETQFSDLNIVFYDWSITLMWRNCLMVGSLWRSVGIAGFLLLCFEYLRTKQKNENMIFYR